MDVAEPRERDELWVVFERLSVSKYVTCCVDSGEIGDTSRDVVSGEVAGVEEPRVELFKSESSDRKEAVDDDADLDLDNFLVCEGRSGAV